MAKTDQPTGMTNKRPASSPPKMEENPKHLPIPSHLQTISLESDTDQSETEDSENTTLTHGQLDGDHQPPTGIQPPADPITLATVNERVDRLLMNFESFNKKLEKNSNKCRKKFLNLQSAHNAAVGNINTLSDRADKAEDFSTQTRALVDEGKLMNWR